MTLMGIRGFSHDPRSPSSCSPTSRPFLNPVRGRIARRAFGGCYGACVAHVGRLKGCQERSQSQEAPAVGSLNQVLLSGQLTGADSSDGSTDGPRNPPWGEALGPLQCLPPVPTK